MQDNPKVSTVLLANNAKRKMPRTDLATVGVAKRDRLRILREVLGDDTLSHYMPTTLKAAVDGCYWLSPCESEELKALARQVADTNIPLARLGRGTVFAKLVSQYKQSH